MSVNPNEGQPGQGYPGNQEYPGNQGYSGYPGGQGYPPPPVGTYPQPSAGGGLNFQDLYQRWRAVLSIGMNPGRGVVTFDAQQPAANWSSVLWGVGILGAFDAVFNVITGAEFHRAGTSAPGVGTFISGFIGAFIGFFILAGVLYLIAKLFSGTGTFLTYSYLLSLIYVPLGIISAVAGILPLLGGLIALAAGIYEIILAIYATMSAHRLSMGQSTAVVLIPVVILFLLVILLTFAIGLALFAAYGLSR